MVDWSQPIDIGEKRREFFRAVIAPLPKYRSSSVVEVGCWVGALSREVVALSVECESPLHLFCVDMFKGTKGHAAEERCAKQSNIEEGWRHTMLNAIGSSFEVAATPIALPSIEAAALFDDESADIVYIDADHSYEGVKADIDAWWPKVKKHGGIMCGHDYDGAVTPDVKRAVVDAFGEEWIELFESSHPTGKCFEWKVAR